MRIGPIIFFGSLLCLLQPAFASDEDDMAAMQKQLNAEVFEQPFLAEQPAKVEAYIQEALKKNLVPPEYSGIYWRRGYTCRDLLRHSWQEYRNCRYYYRRHGRYYPYR
jgi:hypothetical protein